jgi:hypothetical protein
MNEIINIEGIDFEVEAKLPAEGEYYIAERNTGPKLLTAKMIDHFRGYIVPVEKGVYCFNFDECKRVVRMIE